MLAGCSAPNDQPQDQGEIASVETNTTAEASSEQYESSDLAMLEYEDSEYIKVNDNVPEFSEDEKMTEPQVLYSDLDDLGRCGKVFAILDYQHMPDGNRGSIGMYKPSGWPDKVGNSKYDFIDGKYLFNRSHLLGWQFWGDETNNEKNLITGTRQMNAGHAGMLKYESSVASYLRYHDGNHVAYRVTPHFRNDELIARGVQMEAWSVEDEGKLHFNIYIFNVQDGVEFSYYDGSSHATGEASTDAGEPVAEEVTYYINTYSGKFHTPNCQYANKDSHEATNLSREQLIEDGYEPCQVCNP